MKLELKRPIIFLDLESTGTSVTKDRITEVCALKIHPSGEREKFATLVNPGQGLSEEIVAMTGIRNEDLISAPTFASIAPALYAFLQGSDFAGYGIEAFDMLLMWEELYRCQIEWDLDGASVIDAVNIFKKREPRTLAGAVRFYLCEDHTGAHRAEADVLATEKVLDGMLDRYGDLPGDVIELAEATKYSDRVDLAGKFIRNAEGVEVFSFGKWEGHPIRSQMGYLKWMVTTGDFPEQTKMIARAVQGERFEAVHKALA